MLRKLKNMLTRRRIHKALDLTSDALVTYSWVLNHKGIQNTIADILTNKEVRVALSTIVQEVGQHLEHLEENWGSSLESYVKDLTAYGEEMEKLTKEEEE